MKRVTGTVVAQKGKFFVKVGDQMHELVPNALGGPDTLKATVDQEVQVILSDPQPIAIITVKAPGPKCYAPCFICYVPVDSMWNWKINEAIREANLDTYLKEGLISQEIHDQQMRRKTAG